MGNRESGSHEAVFFLDNHQVTRRLLFSEFEALLDGMGVLPDYADEEAKAVYAIISNTGKIRALVFFILYFDDTGQADASWNVPVERLAEVSGAGPDLGGGPIRLACRGQCSINWHLNDLWDPDMTPGSNDFLLVKKVVDENRLRLSFDDEVVDDIPVLSASGKAFVSEIDEKGSEAEKRLKLARLIKEQRLRIKTLESNREQSAESTDREQKIILHAYKNEIQSNKQSIEQLKLINEKLKEKLASRNDQFIHLQDRVTGQASLVETLEVKLKDASVGERAQLEKQKMEAEIVLLKELLDRKEIDLAYRDEREEQLRAELEELSESIGHNVQSDSTLDKLKELDVVYVSYHAGVGHINMTSLEINDYVDNANAFVANKCFVTESLYLSWLDHYEHSSCNFMADNGVECGARVEKVSVPSDFELGVSDRCETHQQHEIT